MLAGMDDLLAIPLMIGALALPLLVFAVLIALSRRRFAGRRSRFDGALGGVARGHVQASHLEAGTPSADDIAVPILKGPPSGR